MRKWIAVLCLVVAAALAQDQKPANHAPGVQTPSNSRVVVRTRLVAMYSQIEEQILAAAKARKQADIERLLADDFAIWSPITGGQPIPKDAWLNMLASSELVSYRIDYMSVKAVGTTNVVAFSLSEVVHREGKEDASAFWIVDVWDTAGGQQKLTSRYAAPIEMTGAQTRPTGKE